ncbi:hypothetical protein [Nocardiopsis ansamitocini]|uniref:DUF4232 domain-containing protein n=1 Tax=Nocardiopsis ansamitocini TaxID=1670832 RepID=A0A9W6P651_9ACTN|nr:hypothetical protein [Nocardiopsis ansamitocini]GLU47758.1 hypothetical protein Nans01_21090 [Nocardiopsis ansamitocini]
MAGILAALTTALLTGSASYAGEASSSTSPTPSESRPILGTSEASKSTWDGAIVEIRELKRSKTGEYAQLVWTLKNNSNANISLVELENTTYIYPGSSTGSGLVLIDEKQGVRFNPYIDSDQDCMCAGADHLPTMFHLITYPEFQNTYWASYRLSAETEKVTVEIPGFLPIKDVPVS